MASLKHLLAYVLAIWLHKTYQSLQLSIFAHLTKKTSQTLNVSRYMALLVRAAVNNHPLQHNDVALYTSTYFTNKLLKCL